MKTIRILTALLVLIVANQASAQTTLRIKSETPEAQLTTLPLDGSGDALSFTTNVSGYAVLNVYVNHSVHTSSTDIVMACTATPDGGAPEYDMKSCVLLSGNCTGYTATWTEAIGGVEAFRWQVSVIGDKTVTCTFTSTAAAATDLISVSTRMVTQ